MATRLPSSRTLLLLPLVLLVVVLLEELSWQALRDHVRSVPLRVALRMTLNGAAFAIAARRIEPWLRTGFRTVRTGSRRQMGSFGPLVFYVLAYGLLYGAFYVLETEGPRALLP
jgi:hypothetical protein